jgi:HEAT repeat protein
MVEHSQSHLQIIGELAREYEQKYKELALLISELPPERVIPQLRALAERTTDRFRAAQIGLFSIPGLFDGDDGDVALRAATALCSAFDEMRIILQFFGQKLAQPDEGE